MQNGGVIQTTGDMTLSYQQTTNGATTTVTINDGLFAANGHIYMGRDGLSGAGTFTLPVQGTYREESSNDGTMLRGVDFEANRRALYSFIYR